MNAEDAVPDPASLLFDNLLALRRGISDSTASRSLAVMPAGASFAVGPLSEKVSAPSGSGPGVRFGMPQVGDSLFGFRLRQELGRGSFARVYLAEQHDLAGRLVVLKLSAAEGGEHQTLAQLQHTNIVPIHSVHEDARLGLRAVCMPYFGGASLSQVLARLWEGGPPRDGRQFADALRAVQGPPPAGGSGALALPENDSYIRAAIWVVAGLAEGLAHAHQRGVLHRDIKPSNVLLSADGTPLLLDFNLAQDTTAGGQLVLGGTVAYMAPEHLRAVGGRSEALARIVDHRADLYGLGMVLFEMLTGHRPFDQSASYSALPVMIEAMALERARGAPSLRAERPDAPWGLESVLRKCLAPEPEARYQTASELAEDLRRLLDDRPLRYAPELSLKEQAQKWTRRHPRLTASGLVTLAAAILLAGAGLAIDGLRDRLGHTQEQLAGVEAQQRKQQFDDGAARALCLVNTQLDLQDHLAEGTRACESTLGLYGVLDKDWREPADWARLEASERQALAEDCRELLLLLAWARVRQKPGDTNILRGALRLLDRAETISGPSRAVGLERASYLEQLGETERAKKALHRAEAMAPTGARDHHQLAVACARQGGRDGYLRAIRELDRALALNPRHYWSWVQRGICYQEMGDAVQASADFGACIGLRPDFAWGYFCRAWLIGQQGKHEEAVRDYSAALQRNPSLVPARVNRGLALLELKRHSEALADFDAASRLGKDTPQVHAGRGMALEGLGRHDEADAAFEAAFARCGDLPATARAQLHWTHGFALAGRKPEQARQAFGKALALEPANPQALYGLGYLASEQGRPVEAIAYFTRAAEADPHFAEPRRSRALLLARAGLLEKAAQDINWCLEKASDSGDTLYTAACVASLAADRLGDRAAADQAIALLRKALARGIDAARARTDPDLAALRGHREFPGLTGGGKDEP